MPMTPYPVRCYAPGCTALAEFKIAGRWSDGVTNELKTYFLSCPDCLPGLFGQALAKHAACRLTTGEVLEPPGIFEIVRGERDKALRRRSELEEQLARNE